MWIFDDTIDITVLIFSLWAVFPQKNCTSWESFPFFSLFKRRIKTCFWLCRNKNPTARPSFYIRIGHFRKKEKLLYQTIFQNPFQNWMELDFAMLYSRASASGSLFWNISIELKEDRKEIFCTQYFLQCTKSSRQARRCTKAILIFLEDSILHSDLVS